MRSIHIVFAAVCAALLAGSAFAAPVAMVTDLQGAVATAKDKAKLGLMAYVEPGTEIQLEAKSRLTLTYLAKALEQTFTGPARVMVQADKVEVLQGSAGQSRKLDPEQVSSARKFEPAARERMAQATFVMRSAAPPGKIEVLGPADTRVASVTPEFSWQAPGGTRQVKLTLLDDQGKTLQEQTIDGNKWRPHPGVLAYGKAYQWKIEANEASGQTGSAAAFSVLDKAAAAKIAKQMPKPKAPFSARLLYAAQLENEGLKYEAAPLWRALAAERPDEPALQRWAK